MYQSKCVKSSVNRKGLGTPVPLRGKRSFASRPAVGKLRFLAPSGQPKSHGAMHYSDGVSLVKAGR